MKTKSRFRTNSALFGKALGAIAWACTLWVIIVPATALADHPAAGSCPHTHTGPGSLYGGSECATNKIGKMCELDGGPGGSPAKCQQIFGHCICMPFSVESADVSVSELKHTLDALMAGRGGPMFPPDLSRALTDAKINALDTIETLLSPDRR